MFSSRESLSILHLSANSEADCKVVEEKEKTEQSRSGAAEVEKRAMSSAKPEAESTY